LRNNVLALILALAALTAPCLRGQSVSVEKGCVYFKDAAGKSRRLTTGGRDSAPVLSPDKKTVAFVRATPGQIVSCGSGDVEATELWALPVDGSQPAKMLLRGAAHEKMERVLCEFNSPAFSPDGKTIYFLSAAWATSNALHAIDLRGGEARYICAANSLEMVGSGEYRGNLIISQHRYFLGGGSYDWHYLFTPKGKEIGILGESPANFKDTYLK
jgi:dipeptidyl aminopeptidase/acylaminoacyl peptidase